MTIQESTVAEVVAEVSDQMSDPNFSAVIVGGFVQQQPQAAQYISAHAAELGGQEGVVGAIFHAGVLGMCFQRGEGRSVREMAFEELDHVSEGDREAALADVQPALLEYLKANVEGDTMRRILMLIALAMDWVS